MTIFEILTIAISVGAFGLSLFVFYWADKRYNKANQLSNLANTKAEEANRIANDANKIANKSLDVNMYSYKIAITPNIDTNWCIPRIDNNNPENDYIEFNIKNLSGSPITVIDFECLGIFHARPMQRFPDLLKQGVRKAYNLEIRDYERTRFQQSVLSEENTNHLYRQFINAEIRNCTFQLVAKTTLNDFYLLRFEFDNNENKFVHTISELN